MATVDQCGQNPAHFFTLFLSYCYSRLSISFMTGSLLGEGTSCILFLIRDGPLLTGFSAVSDHAGCLPSPHHCHNAWLQIWLSCCCSGWSTKEGVTFCTCIQATYITSIYQGSHSGGGGGGGGVYFVFSKVHTKKEFFFELFHLLCMTCSPFTNS